MIKPGCIYCHKPIMVKEMYSDLPGGSLIHTETCIFKLIREVLENELEHQPDEQNNT